MRPCSGVNPVPEQVAVGIVTYGRYITSSRRRAIGGASDSASVAWCGQVCEAQGRCILQQLEKQSFKIEKNDRRF